MLASRLPRGTAFLLSSPATRISARCVARSAATVASSAVVGDGVEIGEDCVIEDFAVVGPDVVLAPGVRIGSHCSVSHCRIGERSRLWPGSHLGQDGFGFIPGAAEGEAASKVPQLRGIVIGSDVEIGAGCTVDRGSRRDTTIGDGCKLDNQVHIGHNVHLGAHCLIAAQTGIAGSVTVGRGVLIGGQAGLAQHLTVGDGARIAARAAVMRDVEAGATVGGSPAVPMSEYRRQSVLLSRLARNSGVVRRLLALIGA